MDLSVPCQCINPKIMKNFEIENARKNRDLENQPRVLKSRDGLRSSLASRNVAKSGSDIVSL